MRADGGFLVSRECEFADFQVIADAAAEPPATGHPHFVEKAPVAHGDVGHQARRTVKLAVSLAMGFREIGDDVFGGPATAGYDGTARFEATKFSAFFVDHRNRG